VEFILLLTVSLLVAICVTTIIVLFFRKHVDKILGRIIQDEISSAWGKFITFALYVIGISSGVNVWRLEKIIAPEGEGIVKPILNAEYWGLTIYRTIIDTLGGMAWALFLFFVVALIAFVIVKKKETKQT